MARAARATVRAVRQVPRMRDLLRRRRLELATGEPEQLDQAVRRVSRAVDRAAVLREGHRHRPVEWARQAESLEHVAELEHPRRGREGLDRRLARLVGALALHLRPHRDALPGGEAARHVEADAVPDAELEARGAVERVSWRRGDEEALPLGRALVALAGVVAPQGDLGDAQGGIGIVAGGAEAVAVEVVARGNADLAHHGAGVADLDAVAGVAVVALRVGRAGDGDGHGGDREQAAEQDGSRDQTRPAPAGQSTCDLVTHGSPRGRVLTALRTRDR